MRGSRILFPFTLGTCDSQKFEDPSVLFSCLFLKPSVADMALVQTLLCVHDFHSGVNWLPPSLVSAHWRYLTHDLEAQLLKTSLNSRQTLAELCIQEIAPPAPLSCRGIHKLCCSLQHNYTRWVFLKTKWLPWSPPREVPSPLMQKREYIFF